MKKLFFIALTAFLIQILSITAFASNTDFDDIPKGHWAYEYVNKMRSLNITEGVGDNNFGAGQSITKAEFTTFLCKLMNYEISSPETGSFSDNMDKSKWYFPYVETALNHGIITSENGQFFPLTNITRQEIAIMIIRALSLDELAKGLNKDGSPFHDVTENAGYITIAKDLGIVSGMGDNSFMPAAQATREQAAVMMIGMHNIMLKGTKDINGFYAIKSNSQKDVISMVDYTSFGWARLEAGAGDIFLNITSQNNNEYRIPEGFSDPYGMAKEKLIFVSVKDEDSRAIINDTALRQKAAVLIGDAVNNGITHNGNTLTFDGVVVDFETLKGSETKNSFNSFLRDLRGIVGNKKIFTAVHPERRTGLEYYNGYDFKTIGELSDKVILMAHDYNPKKLSADEMEQNLTTTPLSPINEIYYALKAITDKSTGVSDKSKIMLQLSFGTCQWKSINNKIINETPFTPDYDALISRIKTDPSAEIKYSKTYESPYIVFKNTLDGTDNIIWYEDTRSIAAKLKLARLFGIEDISLWRLGTIPDYEKEYYLNVKEYLFNN
ncbi:S-layer homology domain-containing protein [Anaeropeptidivorans aminofermentans]|uniref:S-layer homology domain-containing protein n=1 Tax=Anaeropeptidivorans aminofermentans TaxID=2934315 RepID=UPI0020252107|nr:S-layer homology domain-containing protein [Anaeropeptidivorans aminofermentans]